MRSILEKAFVALLNEEHDKAEELFHKFIVERARQIHESNRAGEDFVLDENWEEEITTESYFTEEDLADLEDGEGEAGGEGEENPFAAADDAEGAEFGADEEGAEAAGDELAGELGADDLEGDDFGADDFGADEVDAGESSIESLEDKIDELTAKFEEMMDAIGSDDSEDFGSEDDADADVDADADASADDFGGAADVDASAVEDDMDGAEEESEDDTTMESEESDDEFDDISESIISELEKVQVSLTTDGVEIAAGKSFQQNKTSSIPQKSKEARQGGEPIKQKVTNHKHFSRETAPTVADMKARKNTLKKADSTQSKVSKEGDASAEINKIDSNGNNKSLTPGGKPGFKAR